MVVVVKLMGSNGLVDGESEGSTGLGLAEAKDEHSPHFFPCFVERFFEPSHFT